MTIPQPQESKAYSPPRQTWKWEKRHWLLAIALVCLVFWWFGSKMLEVSLVKKTVALLPAIGGACFAANSIAQLIQ